MSHQKDPGVTAEWPVAGNMIRSARPPFTTNYENRGST
ncbi:hypothetical protein Z949_948 [Sulfitobacter guttiformis KCTC 32187]|nr:hypothetical protein Z949_948 [Sulfitobacter guttiformis KCTC 32187]